MKFNFTYILLIVSSILFISCDPNTSILIVNNNSENVKINLEYNKEFYSSFFEKYKNIDFYNSIQSQNSNNSNLKIISCDTLNSNLSFLFKLQKNDSLTVDSSRGSYPYYEKIKKITVFKKNNKIIEYKSNDFEDMFKKNGNIFVFDIK